MISELIIARSSYDSSFFFAAFFRCKLTASSTTSMSGVLGSSSARICKSCLEFFSGFFFALTMCATHGALWAACSYHLVCARREFLITTTHMNGVMLGLIRWCLLDCLLPQLFSTVKFEQIQTFLLNKSRPKLKFFMQPSNKKIDSILVPS